LWGLNIIQFLGPSLRKIIHNYENEVRYKFEYLFRKRKEITPNLKKADIFYKYHKIKKKL